MRRFFDKLKKRSYRHLVHLNAHDQNSKKFSSILMSMASFFEVMIERDFSSAHQLRGYKGKCENLHGHNYKVEIYARGEELNNIGLLIDFGDLKKAADEIVRYLDHRNLNELPPFDEELNPSAENIARYFVEYLNTRLEDDRVKVYKVRCYETPTSVATYQIE
ncbi:MAG TPA: 6-carboxytetrahydropterin synthase QueD [Pyrinomonadaceae bacterium]|nr:6-carboxytetrahydropterin synthase QueD [Pyrinomonadaceae bacterium]HMP65872.1 6-carboxytetrahydropterin synthase QueD [Pyrinomonadaceae bacterium]